MSKYTKKIGSDKSYVRPKITYQEKLTEDEISDKLQGYAKVDNIADVPINTHLRYISTQPDGSQVFRTGGFLQNKQNADIYVMLQNGKVSWSVQTADTVFFRKMSQKEEISAIREQYEKKLLEKDQIIDKLKTYIKAKIGPVEKSTISYDDLDFDTFFNKKTGTNTKRIADTKPKPVISAKKTGTNTNTKSIVDTKPVASAKKTSKSPTSSKKTTGTKRNIIDKK